MFGRLRLLKGYSIPSKILLLGPIQTNLIPIQNFSSFSPKSIIFFCKNSRKRCNLLSHLIKARSFCAQATGIEESYQSVRISCPKDAADILSETLLCFGATSASMDEVEGSKDLAETWITSIFTDGHDVHACVSHAASSIGLDYIPKYEVSMGKASDWIAKIQGTFHPIEVTDGLWIIPKWRTPLDPQAVNIILDPGLTFGTGEHPTTKLCLLLLHRLIKGGEHIFDYGTGSGVLGIAALKMGAAFSVGIDIDPHAVTSACQNVVLNGIDSNKMSVFLVPTKICLPDTQEKIMETPEEQASENVELVAIKQKFDVVIANILLNPLMDLAEDIIGFAKPGAVVGLSGILSEQVQQIEEQYSQYLDNISASEMDGWACLQGTRKRTCCRDLVDGPVDLPSIF